MALLDRVSALRGPAAALRRAIRLTEQGQAPKAFIRQKPDTEALTLDDMKAFLKTRIGKHEMIAAMAIVDALPRTPVGKIDKKPLYAAEAVHG